MNKLLHFAESQKTIDFVATRLGGSAVVVAAMTALALMVAHLVK
jgi:hypothetical protein